MSDESVRAELRAALDAVESAPDPTARVIAGRLVRQLAEQLEYDLVKDARAAGVRWVDLGELYGTSKQGVQQRFRRRDARSPAARESSGDDAPLSPPRPGA